jgi:hypothetical protein
VSAPAPTSDELGSVQLRKRLYAEAATSLKLALKGADGEPAEAQALIQNALGFALAAPGQLRRRHPPVTARP